MGFPTKNDYFGVFWRYHCFWKHPYLNDFRISSLIDVSAGVCWPETSFFQTLEVKKFHAISSSIANQAKESVHQRHIPSNPHRKCMIFLKPCRQNKGIRYASCAPLRKKKKQRAFATSSVGQVHWIWIKLLFLYEPHNFLLSLWNVIDFILGFSIL